MFYYKTFLEPATSPRTLGLVKTQWGNLPKNKGDRPSPLDRSARLKILVVDDNTDVLRSMGALLTFEGHTVTLASSPTEALAHAAQNSPDVIVLDIGMPQIDGYQLAKAVRALNTKPRALIIAVSGFDSPEHRMHGRLAGFDFHFSKTVSPDAILKVMSDHSAGLIPVRPQTNTTH